MKKKTTKKTRKTAVRITKIQKRDGSIVAFKKDKIIEAIWKAAKSVGGEDKHIAETLAVYVIAVYQLAPLCRILWPVLLIPMIIYPYMKRFSYFCHFVLGISLGLAPLGAWIAVSNTFPPFRVVLLGIAICFWTAGFDIIYACQDYEYDKKNGLFSIPACFGLKKALEITSVLHRLTVGLLFAIGFLFGLQLFYFLGVLVVASVLWYENHIISPGDLSKVNLAFFTVNGVVSILILFFTWMDFVAV